MSYTLVITDEAAADLLALVESLPTAHRADAIDAVDVALTRLSDNPLPKAGDYFGRPAHEFSVPAGGITRRWGAAYRISSDEAHLVITHIFKVRHIL